MKNTLSILFVGLLIFVACKPQNNEPTSVEEETGYQYFGEKIEEINTSDMSEVLAQLETKDSVFTQLKAEVEAVCQTKGCWMNLIDGSSESNASIFVKFKDYGFFMPKDIAGKTVIVEGYAYREVTSVEELKHYAEDEGLSEEEIAKITEPEEELKFMANGVILL